MKHLNILLIFILSASSSLRAQDADSLLLGDELDFLLTGDSASIFSLIDSLLNAELPASTSQLAARLGYNSNVLAAGRTLGIENFGLSSGLSYYHKSGLFAHVSGFWSRDFDPTYYLTIASVGYSRLFNKYFSLIASYDRYFYNTNNEDAYIPYRNSFTVSPMFDVKVLSTSLAYSFYFGDKHVHRLTPSIGLTLQKKNIGPFTRITLLPSFLVLFGNESFTESEILIPQTRREALENLRTYGKVYPIIETTQNVFGIMNYTVAIPLSVSIKKTTIGITYAYNVPKALPGETLTISESSYLSANLTHFFDFRSHKKPLQ